MKALSLLLAAVAITPPVVVQSDVATVPSEFATPIGNQKLKPDAIRVENLLVEIKAGEELIWAGHMGVNHLSGARYSFKITNAEPVGCPDPIRGATSGSDLSVELGNTYYGMYGRPNEYRVSVNYARTRPSASCTSGNRIQRVEETVHLLPGGETTLSGDGNFKVRIARPASS